MEESSLVEELAQPAGSALPFLLHGGRVGQEIAARDWAGSPLGDIGSWPEPLKSAVSLILGSVQPMFIAWGPQLTFLSNDAYQSVFGENTHAQGHSLPDASPEVWAYVGSAVEDALGGRPRWTEGFASSTTRNGYPEQAFFSFASSPIRDTQGAVAGVLCTGSETAGKCPTGQPRNAMDAALLHSQEQLRQSNDYLNTIINQASVGIAQTDLEGRFMLVNDRYCELLGRSRKDLLGRTMRELTHPEDQLCHAEAFERVIRTGTPLFVEKRGLRPDGSYVWVNSHLALNRDQNGIPKYVIKVVVDITERKENELYISHMATHDSLTQLPNRVLLKQNLIHSVQAAQYLGQKVAVLFLDLNRFKNVNDSLGHDQGDRLLKIMAERLSACVREGDTVARVGGDEFAIVLDGLDFLTEAMAIAEEVLAAVARPVRLSGHEVSISTSIGISAFPRDGSDHVVLLKSADTAMYRAKELGGSILRFYNPEMNGRLLERLLTESSLRHAIGRGELVMHYQPRVSIARNTIVGVEALVRWDHPENGLMLPDDFITIAEESGLIDELGQAVLNLACEQGAQWQRQGLPPICISVNISPRQLALGNLPEVVRNVLQKTGLDPCLLELEITESGLMHNIAVAQRTLQEIRELGVGLSIDDFGTGYSSLSHLKRLPIDTLKIDKSFVCDLPHDADDVSIVTATIALAKSMNLRVIAEGVRTWDQLYFLSDRGCEEVQGYLFGRPLPAQQIEAVLQNPQDVVPSLRPL